MIPQTFMRPWGGTGSLFREGRSVWKNSLERLSETRAREVEQILERAGVQENQRGSTREAIARLFGQDRRRREEREEREEGEGEEREPSLGGLSEDPDVARRQIERAMQQVYVNRARKEAEQRVGVERGPVLRNVGRTGLIAASTAFVPAYMAYLGSTSAVLASAVGGGVGAYLGHRWGPDRYPKASMAVGASVGVVSTPLLGQFCAWIGPKLAMASSATAAATVGFLAAPLGYLLGYNLARREWWFKKDSFYGKQRGKPVSHAVGITTAMLSMIGGNTIASTLGAKIVGVQSLGNGIAWLGSTLPTFGVSSAGLIGAGSLGLTAAAGAGALYALGRLEGKIWNRKRTGLMGNMLRGAISPATLTAALLWKPSKWALGKTKRSVGRHFDATKRIFTGKSSAVKAVTSPIWWPIRTTYRAGKGVVKGFWNGLTGKEPSQKPGIVERTAAFVPKVAGKVIRSPYTLGKWLLSPTWGAGKS